MHSETFNGFVTLNNNIMAKKKTKYRSIQKILSVYTKKKGIHLGRGFNKVASKIYKSGGSLKDIRKNIGKLQEDYSKPETVIFIPDAFDFYNFDTEIDLLEGFEVNIIFPQMPEFNFSGLQLDAIEHFSSSGLKVYLRSNYNSSPIARFILEDTDNKTFVTYRVDIDGVEAVPRQIEMPTLNIPVTKNDKDRLKMEGKKADAISKALDMLDRGLINKKEFNSILKKIN